MKSGSVTILRWGLAFVFFYAAASAFISPESWAGYVPGFVSAIVPTKFFLTFFGLYELVLAGLLFSGKKLYWAALFATITFAAIVVVEFQAIDIVFRDIGLAFSSLALFEVTRNTNQPQ